MYSFIVLGLIPDTSIQITFLDCVDIIVICAELLAIRWLIHRHPLLAKKRMSRLTYTFIGWTTELHDQSQLLFRRATTVAVDEQAVNLVQPE
jgi:hypothetical protein